MALIHCLHLELISMSKYCRGGPWAGKHVTVSQGFGGYSLSLTVRGQTGRYVAVDSILIWAPQ